MDFILFTVIKDEQTYLKEWLDYHFNLGIEKIFVYEDVNSTSHKSITEQYKDKVELNSVLSLYPQKEHDRVVELKRQNRAFAGFQIQYLYRILDRLKQLYPTSWVFYLDADEFLTLKSKRSTLNSVFKSFSKYDLVVLQWQNFNANGHIQTPSTSTVDSYTTPCQLFIGNTMSPKASSKIAFNLAQWDSKIIKTNHHIPKQANWCKTNLTQDLLTPSYDKIYIRHYITKSFEEYCNKLYSRGQIIRVHSLNDFFTFNPDISKDDPNVQAILKHYSNLVLDGNLPLQDRP